MPRWSQVLGTVRQPGEKPARSGGRLAPTRANTGRLTLKSGGRTVWLDARSLDWAESRRQLRGGPRQRAGPTSPASALSALAEQLGAAGRRFVTYSSLAHRKPSQNFRDHAGPAMGFRPQDLGWLGTTGVEALPPGAGTLAFAPPARIFLSYMGRPNNGRNIGTLRMIS